MCLFRLVSFVLTAVSDTFFLDRIHSHGLLQEQVPCICIVLKNVEDCLIIKTSSPDCLIPLCRECLGDTAAALSIKVIHKYAPNDISLLRYDSQFSVCPFISIDSEVSLRIPFLKAFNTAPLDIFARGGDLFLGNGRNKCEHQFPIR